MLSVTSSAGSEGVGAGKGFFKKEPSLSQGLADFNRQVSHTMVNVVVF